VRQDAETGQTLISGMGELHLQIIVDRLKREYGVEAAVGKPQVVYRETVARTAEAETTFQRELKEATLYGRARCRVAPRPRGAGVEIRSEVPEAPPLPPAVREAALAGLGEAAQSGPDGYPMEDISATLLALEFREDAQPEVGVKVAAGEALRKAVAEAGPLRLEPVMRLEVVIPEEHLGAVIGELRQRRAHISDVSERGAVRLARARVGLGRMFGYSTALRSLTRGRATFTMEFDAYDNLDAL
jgi:elongation factor G